MNLREIMTRVENETRHFPDLLGHREDLRLVVNAAYERFCSERPWPWLTHRVPVYSFPDLVIPNAEAELAVGWGARSVLLPKLTTLDNPMYPEELEGQFAFFESMLAGAEFGLVDPTLADAGSGNFEASPFTIEAVVELGAGPGPTIQLDPRANLGASLPSGLGDFFVRFPRVLLPPDVKSVLAMYDPTGRKIRGLTPPEARRWITQENVDRAGTTGWMLEDMGSDLRQPVHIDMFLTDPSRSPFAYQRETWPLRETLELVETITEDPPGPTDIPGNTRIQVFACWFWSGRFGPRSEIQEFTTEDDSFIHEIEVQGYPVLPTTGAQIEYGRRVAIFMAEDEGAFFLRAFVTNPAVVTTTISGRNVAGNTQPGLRYPRYDELVPPGGAYTYLRVYPRPTVFQRLELEYLAHPRRLVEDIDQPEMRDNHEVLVWLSVAQLLASPRYNGDPRSALAMAQTYRAAITAHNYPQDRYEIVRGQVDQPRGPSEFFVGPDIDYQG